MAEKPAYQVRVVGAPGVALHRDLYHRFLRVSWSLALLVVVGLFLFANLLFAVGYLAAGGVVGMRPDSLRDAFVFSVQTMGTIGYGAMYPHGAVAETLMVAEAVTSLLLTALATGLVFAKFAQPNGRVVFASKAVVAPWQGKPTLMIRLGNERGNQVVEAQVRVAVVRNVTTLEGVLFYQMTDLALVRDRSPAFQRSWNVMHVVDETSPLWSLGPADLDACEAEVLVTVAGTDDISFQPVYGRHTYDATAVVFGARHADVLSEQADGDLILDVGKFDQIVPTQPIAGFPYPKV